MIGKHTPMCGVLLLRRRQEGRLAQKHNAHSHPLPPTHTLRTNDRLDFSDQLAFAARAALAANVARGEAGVDLAAAALQVAAEDDAVASSSTVPFPVESYLARIAALADEAAARARASSSAGSGLAALPPAEAVRAVERFLFEEKGFRPAKGLGRSALPPRARLSHPGTREAPAPAYLNEVLVRRQGHPAALAILLDAVLRRLLLAGELPCAALVAGGDWDGLPAAEPLPNVTRELAVGSSGSSGGAGAGSAALLNTCSSEALVELLRHLKRSYFPFPWDTSLDPVHLSHGGFRGAAKAALGAADVSAEVRAISATAAHRLQRGIFTSPGAGDLRRCLAACERVVMLIGDAQPRERRDLGALYLHAGLFDEARAELAEYLRRCGVVVGGGGGSRSSGGGGSRGGALLRDDPFDIKLAQQLIEFIDAGGGGGGAAGGGMDDGSGGRRTLLAPHAAGSAGVEIGGGGDVDAAVAEEGATGGGGSGVALMSVDKILEAAARGGGGAGLLGAHRGRLPLTW